MSYATDDLAREATKFVANLNRFLDGKKAITFSQFAKDDRTITVVDKPHRD